MRRNIIGYKPKGWSNVNKSLFNYRFKINWEGENKDAIIEKIENTIINSGATEQNHKLSAIHGVPGFEIGEDWFADLTNTVNSIGTTFLNFRYLESLTKRSIMKKKTKVVAPYAVNPKTGEGKSLRYEADLSNKDEADFTSDLEAVAATKPRSLGELLERLASLQKANLPM